MDPKYDNILAEILKNEGNLERYLGVIFGFLMRRTDFFIERKPGEKIGFPQGHTFKMVVQAFEKYNNLCKTIEKAKNPDGEAKGVIEKESKIADASPQDSTPSNVGPKPKPTKKLVKKESTGPASTFKRDDQGERFYEAEPDCYNGARYDSYSWSQQILEIDFRIKIPEHITSVKELEIKLSRKQIFISEKDAEVPIIDRELLREVKIETAQWSFDGDEHSVSISLDKVDEYWWECAFVGDEKINVQEIDCSRPMQDLDEESQAKIAQMLFDEEQKRQGLPTCEEKRIQDILKKAWNKEGSPFQGQPFDPSVVSTSGSPGTFPPAKP